jgi:hypothetical protein
MFKGVVVACKGYELHPIHTSFQRRAGKRRTLASCIVRRGLSVLKKAEARLDIKHIFRDTETAKSAGRENFGKLLEFIGSSKKPVTLIVEKTDRYIEP